MGRFFKLVQNEYIKVLRRISTWIMLILIVLASLGLFVVSLIAQNEMSKDRQRYNPSVYQEGQYDNEISYQKEAKPDGYEQRIEVLEFLRDQKVPYGDWRNQAADDMVAAKVQADTAKDAGQDTATVNALKKTAEDYNTAVRNNQWEAYYGLKLAAVKNDSTLSAETKDAQKWQYQYRLDHKIKPDSSDWKSNLIDSTGVLKAQAASLQEQQKSGAAPDMEKLNKMDSQIQTSLYRLEHNIPIDVASAGLTHPQGGSLGFWDVFASSSKMISLISLLIIVIAGSCIANEFSSGTIKFLLINPVKRGKILFSKYVMAISLAYLMLILFYLMNVLFGVIFYGAGGMGIPYLYLVGGTVHSYPAFLYVAWQYLLASVDILVMATLAFAISSLIRSSALAIGVGVFAMLGGKTLILFLKQALKFDWARYLIFANTDLSSILDGSSMFAHQSVQFALIVVAVHLFVFLLTAWDGFVRREI